jgi:hypothetical protein
LPSRARPLYSIRMSPDLKPALAAGLSASTAVTLVPDASSAPPRPPTMSCASIPR